MINDKETNKFENVGIFERFNASMKIRRLEKDRILEKRIERKLESEKAKKSKIECNEESINEKVRRTFIVLFYFMFMIGLSTAIRSK